MKDKYDEYNQFLHDEAREEHFAIEDFLGLHHKEQFLDIEEEEIDEKFN